MDLSEIYNPVESEMVSLEEVLGSSLKHSKVMLAHEVGSFIAESPGKRIRPGLVLLAAKCCKDGQAGVATIDVAAAMELVHVASLVHDDVIDKSPLRHNKPTVNMKWKEEVGILFGDYVYSIGIGLVAKSGTNGVLKCLTDTVTVMCEGQLEQVTERDNFELSYDNYISIVSKKTASLFSVCCKLGAIMAGGGSEMEEKLGAYGMNMGIAYQIIDDYRDVVGLKAKLGKDPGQDIVLGEITLPIMNLLAVSEGEKKSELIELLKGEQSPETMDRIRDEFVNSQAAVKTRASITHYIDKANEALSGLPDSDSKLSLAGLVNILSRKVAAEAKV